MRDFASPYRKVPYFGIWAEETADQYGKRRHGSPGRRRGMLL
jgi:hypothetical protein